ncbi:immunity 17 family protein [uncultured Muribaculum sp.]|uniref:immunity 17 family protein n=1 Tax=uncultured Muribaculum sp. TaxID=1918613 RepID=UPI00266F518D|nr:immunity 17 family protein [uncultured Muribaculum sp.]
MTPSTASRILAVLFLISGSLSLLAAVAGWDWFFRSYNVRILTGQLKRGHARILYALIGLAIIAAGIYTWTNIPE